MRQAADCAWLVSVLQYNFSPQGVSRYGFNTLIYFPKFHYIRFVFNLYTFLVKLFFKLIQETDKHFEFTFVLLK